MTAEPPFPRKDKGKLRQWSLGWRIVEWAKEHGQVTYEQLQLEFKAHPRTIRNVLSRLRQLGYVETPRVVRLPEKP